MWLALWLVPVIALLATLGSGNVFSEIAVFFSKMAMVTFGGAYAVLAYVAQQAVENYGWLKPGEMLDGLGMAETTPGPLIMVLQFVGLHGGVPRSRQRCRRCSPARSAACSRPGSPSRPASSGSSSAPPSSRCCAATRALNGALSAITAAVVGVILNLAIWFALHTVFRQDRAGARLSGSRSMHAGAHKRRSAGRSRSRSRRSSPSSASRSGMIPTLLACCAVGVVLHLAGALA